MIDNVYSKILLFHIFILILIYSTLPAGKVYGQFESKIYEFQDEIYNTRIFVNPLEPFTNEIRFEVELYDKNDNLIQDATVKIRSSKINGNETGWAYALNNPSTKHIYSTILSLPPNGSWTLSVEIMSSLGKKTYPVNEITIEKETRSALGGWIFFGAHFLILGGGLILWRQSRRIRNK